MDEQFVHEQLQVLKTLKYDIFKKDSISNWPIYLLLDKMVLGQVGF